MDLEGHEEMFSTIKLYLGIALISFALAATAVATVQTVRLDNERKISSDLEQTLVDIKAAIILTEQLVTDNATLTQERDDLRKELQNADGYNTPLSGDIIRVIDRLHGEAGTPIGAP